MPDNIKLPNQKSIGNEVYDNNLSSSSGDNRQAIFDERFAALTDAFGKACEEQNVTNACLIAKHPKEDKPIIFIRGHLFDVAELTGSVLRQINDELMARLSGR